MSTKLLTLLCLFCSVSVSLLTAQTTASIHGLVINSQTGQNLPAFAVELLGPANRHNRNASQEFELENLPSGDYVLQVDAPGFTEAESQFHLEAGERKEFEVTMSVEQRRKGDIVEVRAAAMADPPEAPGGTVATISGKQLQNLSSVLADDPLRAVQSLPGVAADNDLEAKFSVRGADFNRIGVFLDGVRLPDPLHSFQGSGLAGSASFLNRAMVDELSLYNSPVPERFGDTSAGALDVKLREGSADAYHMQAGVNFAQANIAAEGPFGSEKACSWAAGFRKTYLQYVLAGRLPDASMLFGVQDEQERSTCHLNDENMLSFDAVDSVTSVDQSSARKTLPPLTLMNANQHTDVTNLGWMYTPTDKLMIQTHAAYIWNSFGEDDAGQQPIGKGQYSERAWNSIAEWFPDAHLGFAAGVDLRSMSASGNTRILYAIAKYALYDTYSGSDTLFGGFMQQTFAAGGGRVHAAISERWDRDSADGQSRLSPAASVSVRVLSPLKIEAGWGQYVQFPDLSILTSVLGGPHVLPLQSTQGSVGIALRLGENATLRATVYERNDTDLPYQPYADPRLLNGSVFFPPALPVFTNSLSGRSHGYEITFQRSTSRRVSGFLSYSNGHTQLTDSITRNSFPSDWDQRHSVSGYLDYAWRRNIDLSTRYTFGSGFPIPGYVTERDGRYYLSGVRSSLRLPYYQSLDLRLNKTIPHERWRMKLYFEVVNATNSANEAWGGLVGFTKLANRPIQVSKLAQFPILPSLGMDFQF